MCSKDSDRDSDNEGQAVVSGRDVSGVSIRGRGRIVMSIDCDGIVSWCMVSLKDLQ